MSIIPVLFLLAFPSGAIQTTYSYQEFWHLFWLALIPTGSVLFLIHALRTLGNWFVFAARGTTKLFGSLHSKRIHSLQNAGDSNRGDRRVVLDLTPEQRKLDKEYVDEIEAQVQKEFGYSKREPSEVSRSLRAARMAAGMTLAEVAERAGMTNQAVLRV